MSETAICKRVRQYQAFDCMAFNVPVEISKAMGLMLLCWYRMSTEVSLSRWGFFAPSTGLRGK